MSSLSNFQKLKELGKGSFSTVYKVCRKSDNKEYAMKVVKITQLSEKERQNALNEIRILASIVDPNIIAYKEAFFDEGIRCLCIIMEYADAGDLMQKINAKKAQRAYFSESQIWKFLIQMTKGLKTLHSLKILHRDLKCANIFQTNDGVVKLGDLNVSKITQKGLAITQAGTPYYCAPEVWKGNVYDKKCDIWSLGCVIYELAALKPPFQGTGMKDLFNRISKGEFDRIPKCYSNELQDIIRQCLKINPNERPNCDDILANPLIREKFPEELPREKVFSKAQLLNTIKMPKNLQGLREKLPKPNYQLNNKSFEEEEEERNFMRRCPSESGLREKKDVKDVPTRLVTKNSYEENEKQRGAYDVKNMIPKTPKYDKYEDKSPLHKKQPVDIKSNRGAIERPPIQRNYANYYNYPQDKVEKNDKQFQEKVEKNVKHEKAGAIKSNKVEQPLKKLQIEENRNYMKPPIEPPRNAGRIERPLSRPEIKRALADNKKPIVNNNNYIGYNQPALVNNKRPSSQQDPRRMKEQEKIVERRPQIKNNNLALKKAEEKPKMIPRTPVSNSNKENVIVGRRYPGVEVKNKKK